MPKSGIKLKYSSINNKGHFGIPKLIIANASTYTLLDLKGEYGLTQFAYGIVDSKENLVKIQKVLDNPDFHKPLTSFIGRKDNCLIVPNGQNTKFLKEFRKDFWKDFYTENDAF